MQQSQELGSMSVQLSRAGQTTHRTHYGWCCLFADYCNWSYKIARKTRNFQARKLKSLRTHRTGDCHKRCRR